MNNFFMIMGNIVSPDTGDEGFPLIAVIAVVLALGGIIYLLATRNRR